MILKDVLETVTAYLGLSEEIKLSGTALTPLSNKKLNTLIRCANIVYGEFASDYFPLLKDRETEFADNKAYYSLFPDRVINVTAVRDLATKEQIPFRLYPTYIEAAVDRAMVTYCYLPDEIGLTDELHFGLKVSPRLMSLAICAEYCFMQGLYDEGNCYEDRFQLSLRNALIDRRSKTVRGRKWY